MELVQWVREVAVVAVEKQILMVYTLSVSQEKGVLDNISSKGKK